MAGSGRRGVGPRLDPKNETGPQCGPETTRIGAAQRALRRRAARRRERDFLLTDFFMAVAWWRERARILPHRPPRCPGAPDAGVILPALSKEPPQ